MAGEAKTNKFVIGEATVMIGPMATVFDLMPTTHSLGLVKNFAVQVETGNVELTQGIENVPIFSIQNQFNTSGSFEVYEYTARNLAYGLGLDASGAAYDEPASSGPYTLNTAISTSTTAVVLTAGQGTTWVAGDWCILQQNEDQVFAAKVASKSTDTLTLDRAVPGTSVTFATATTRIWRAKGIGASGGNTNFLGMKVSVTMPDVAKPAVLLFPKVRITRGFNMSIGTSDFSNLPFEFTPYPLVSTDALFSSFGTNEVFKLIKD